MLQTAREEGVAPALSEVIEIRASGDLVIIRSAIRARSAEQGFSLVDQTKIVTAASELARNTLTHGGGGRVRVEALRKDGRTGLRLTFEDQGPGIADVELAMKDGYTSGGGLGLGLGGSKRLMSEFDIWSKSGQGTRVTVTRWKLL